MDDLEKCPKCDKSLVGDPIPEEIRHSYSGTHWKLEIGVEYQGVYDGVWEWKCPFCEHTWPSETAKLKGYT